LDLSGKLLIAMPGMGDMRFDRSVIFMCAHSGDGAMGLIVNKPAPELSFRALLKQMSIQASDRSRDIRVHFGGPVEHGRGFVLHSPDYEGSETTLRVDGRFKLTATSDILEAMASGAGPESSLFALGYAGWGAGQLENEIRRNGWLVADASPDLVFSDDNPGKWRGALKTMGIDPLALSPASGHA
jgi:putative transcriptional regulator